MYSSHYYETLPLAITISQLLPNFPCITWNFSSDVIILPIHIELLLAGLDLPFHLILTTAVCHTQFYLFPSFEHQDSQITVKAGWTHCSVSQKELVFNSHANFNHLVTENQWRNWVAAGCGWKRTEKHLWIITRGMITQFSPLLLLCNFISILLYCNFPLRKVQ